MRVDFFHEEGTSAPSIEVPDNVLDAALEVARWLDDQPDKYGLTIYGLQLKLPQRKIPVQVEVDPSRGRSGPPFAQRSP